MEAKGHLECYFQCGVSLSSLEALALHIELDHRENNDISPFVIRQQSLPATASRSPPAAPSRPPPLPPVSASYEQEPTMLTSSSEDEAASGSDESDAAPLSFICEEPGCGEQVLLIELNEHSDMHEAERLTLDEPSSSSDMLNVSTSHRDSTSSISSPDSFQQNFSTSIPAALRRDDQHNKSPKTSPRQSMSRKFLSILGYEKGKPERPPKNSVRLGRADLGPYAYEDQMPDWLLKQLKKGPKIHKTQIISRNGTLIKHEQVEGETDGVLPVLRRLIEYDSAVYMAYLCHPTVKQIGKEKNEGGFCGFRNIQMQASYLQGSGAPGSEHFPGRTPGILELQDQIEQAWDNGIHWYSREQIGKLRQTRKWIGTLEAHAIYQNLGIPCSVFQFSDSQTQYAHEKLLDHVEAYFRDAAVFDNKKVQVTLKPPIYFQRPGHSMTIVGLEHMKDGTRNLLVFDPMFRAMKGMEQLVQKGERYVRGSDSKLMHYYRRPEYRLEHFLDFEVLELTGDNLPIFPAWDVISRFPSCSFVYIFFDVSSGGYEVYPMDLFHPLFPWARFGNLFSIESACFYRQTFRPAVHDAFLPSACVPVLWARRLPTGGVWGETRQLPFDDWIKPDAKIHHSFWNTPASLIAEEHVRVGEPHNWLPDRSYWDSMGYNHQYTLNNHYHPYFSNSAQTCEESQIRDEGYEDDHHDAYPDDLPVVGLADHGVLSSLSNFYSQPAPLIPPIVVSAPFYDYTPVEGRGGEPCDDEGIIMSQQFECITQGWLTGVHGDPITDSPV